MIKNAKQISARAIQSTRDAVHPDALAQYRLLRPLAHRFHDPVYWSTKAGPMAIGISCGLLWAFWIPFGQILIACFHALLFRGNLPAAAVATFVSNPFTFAPLSYLAHTIGCAILGPQTVASLSHAASTQLSSFSLIDALQAHLSNLGIPWLVGMIALGPIAAVAGLLLTPVFMMIFVRRR